MKDGASTRAGARKDGTRGTKRAREEVHPYMSEVLNCPKLLLCFYRTRAVESLIYGSMFQKYSRSN